MNSQLQCRSLRLERRRFLEVVDGEGISITCISGSIWLTQHKQALDVVLTPGRSFVLDCKGKAVVQALEASTVVLSRPASASRPLADAWPMLRLVPSLGTETWPTVRP